MRGDSDATGCISIAATGTLIGDLRAPRVVGGRGLAPLRVAGGALQRAAQLLFRGDEHGTGLAKARYLEKETSAGTILFSSRIKRAMDPKNILNPGKIIAAKA